MAIPIPLTATGGTSATATATSPNISGIATNKANPPAHPSMKAIPTSIREAWSRIVICEIISSPTKSEVVKVARADNVIIVIVRSRLRIDFLLVSLFFRGLRLRQKRLWDLVVAIKAWLLSRLQCCQEKDLLEPRVLQKEP